LSTQAKQIFSGNATFPVGKEGNKLKKELADSGIYDEGLGNEKFVSA